MRTIKSVKNNKVKVTDKDFEGDKPKFIEFKSEDYDGQVYIYTGTEESKLRGIVINKEGTIMRKKKRIDLNNHDKLVIDIKVDWTEEDYERAADVFDQVLTHKLEQINNKEKKDVVEVK